MSNFYQNQQIADLVLSYVQPYIRLNDEDFAAVPKHYANKLLLDPTLLLKNVFIPQWSSWFKAASESYRTMDDEMLHKVMFVYTPAKLLPVVGFTTRSSAGKLLVNYRLDSSTIFSEHSLAKGASSFMDGGVRIFADLVSQLMPFALEELAVECDNLLLSEYRWKKAFGGTNLEHERLRVLAGFKDVIVYLVRMLSQAAVQGDSTPADVVNHIDSYFGIHFSYVEKFKKLGVRV